MSTSNGFGLYNSIESNCGGSVCVSTSLIHTDATDDGGSSVPGEPPNRVLARQFAALFGSEFRLGFTGTSEKPVPSGAMGQGEVSL